MMFDRLWSNGSCFAKKIAVGGKKRFTERVESFEPPAGAKVWRWCCAGPGRTPAWRRRCPLPTTWWSPWINLMWYFTVLMTFETDSLTIWQSRTTGRSWQWIEWSYEFKTKICTHIYLWKDVNTHGYENRYVLRDKSKICVRRCRWAWITNLWLLMTMVMDIGYRNPIL